MAVSKPSLLCSLAIMASLMAYMQQTAEQYPFPQWVDSLEPTHWSQAIFLGSFSSEGRTRCPMVGPGGAQDPFEFKAGEDVLVTAIMVEIFVRAGSKTSLPGQRMTDPTLSLFDRSLLVIDGAGQTGFHTLIAFGTDSAFQTPFGLRQGLFFVKSESDFLKSLHGSIDRQRSS